MCGDSHLRSRTPHASVLFLSRTRPHKPTSRAIFTLALSQTQQFKGFSRHKRNFPDVVLLGIIRFPDAGLHLRRKQPLSLRSRTDSGSSGSNRGL